MNSLLNTALTKKTASRYGEICYFPNDSGAIRLSLETYGEWAENEIRFMKIFLPEGGTAIDVGAYIGTHTLAFADAVGPNGHVLSIEAQQKSFELLLANVKANGLTNVRIENAIAGDRIETRDVMEIDPDNAESFGSTAVMATGNYTNSAIKVRTITIDSLLLSRCDLLKIDVEGMEEDVLKGALETLARLRPTIYAECNTLEDGLRTLLLLKSCGYTVFAHAVDAFNPDNFSQNTDDIFNGAREIAIVGAVDQAAEVCRTYAPRMCELFLQIETADDLALALMNKPQYAEEILRVGVAGRSGGDAILDQQIRFRLDLEACQSDVTILRAGAAADAVAKEQLEQDAGRLRNDNEELTRDVGILRDKIALEGREKSALAFELQNLKHQFGSFELQVISERQQFHLEVASLRQQNAENVHRAQSLQNQIDLIYRSRLWRLGGPFRRIARVARRYVKKLA